MRFVQYLGRLGLLVVVLSVLTVIGIQLHGIVARNVAVSRELAATRADSAALRAKKRRQVREIERLSDPRGAIPEIHERLHLAGSREEIIYLKGLPPPTTPPSDWDSDR